MGKPSRGNTSNIFFLNQAIADCTVSVPVMMHVLPLNIFQHIWQAELYIFTYSVFVSIGSIMINALDRFLSLKKPFHHWRLVTWFRVLLAIISVWSFSMIPVFICIAIKNNEKKFWYCTVATFPIIIVFVIVILLLIFLSSAAINLSISEQSNNIQSQPLSELNEDMVHVEHSKERRMVHIMLAMAFVYAITILPYMIMELINQFDGFMSYAIISISVGATYLLYTVSAIINPLLTLCLKQDFNQILRKYLWRRRKQELQEMDTVIASTEM